MAEVGYGTNDVDASPYHQIVGLRRLIPEQLGSLEARRKGRLEMDKIDDNPGPVLRLIFRLAEATSIDKLIICVTRRPGDGGLATLGPPGELELLVTAYREDTERVRARDCGPWATRVCWVP